MYALMVTKLIVSSGSSSFSRAVEMVGGNAVEVSLDVESITGAAALALYVEKSNDLQNWISGSSIGTQDGLGSLLVSASGIGSRYVRLRFDLSAGTNAVVAAAVREMLL